MRQKDKAIFRRCLAWVLAVAIAACAALGAPGESAQAQTAKGIQVKYHSQKDIASYFKKNKVSLNPATKYDKKPSIKKPYQAGTLKKSSKKGALAVMNAIRYVAGIDANVKLDSSYTKMAQMAALCDAANGQLSHTPARPKGMKESLYLMGLEGASSSNIAWASWQTGLGFSLVSQWMADDDPYNISVVGHRRWVLNPSMKKTGFGWVYEPGVGTYSAMYAFDNAFGEKNASGVAWPAQNMPTELFADGYPWSISMGYAVGDNVKVVLTRKADKKKWTFSKKKSDGFFNVDNGGYGMTGCIIFRPDGVTYRPGDKFHVEITGLEKKVSYDVNFFSLGL